MLKKIRVLVVDDSLLVRQVLTKGLSADPAIEVVGAAEDPYVARDKIVELKPDVLTLDVEMPRMNGVDFLRRLMAQRPMPVVMVSSLTQKGQKVTLDALEAGAVDFVSKPSVSGISGLSGMLTELRVKVKTAVTANLLQLKEKKERAPQESVSKDNVRALAELAGKVVAIGASTGGTEALNTILSQFPATMPGVVVVQHMPPGFTKMFAENLNNACAMKVKEAETGDRIMSGRILVAPGGVQTKVVEKGGVLQVSCGSSEKVSGHCPSVDVMMQSVAESVGADAVGVMLTGMGNDGTKGMLAMKNAGAKNMAQDEASSVVFGMPKQAYEAGGAKALVPLNRISAKIISFLLEKR